MPGFRPNRHGGDPLAISGSRRSLRSITWSIRPVRGLGIEGRNIGKWRLSGVSVSREHRSVARARTGRQENEAGTTRLRRRRGGQICGRAGASGGRQDDASLTQRFAQRISTRAGCDRPWMVQGGLSVGRQVPGSLVLRRRRRLRRLGCVGQFTSAHGCARSQPHPAWRLRSGVFQTLPESPKPGVVELVMTAGHAIRQTPWSVIQEHRSALLRRPSHRGSMGGVQRGAPGRCTSAGLRLSAGVFGDVEVEFTPF